MARVTLNRHFASLLYDLSLVVGLVLRKVPSSLKVVVRVNLLLKGAGSRFDAKSGRMRDYRDRRVRVATLPQEN